MSGITAFIALIVLWFIISRFFPIKGMKNISAAELHQKMKEEMPAIIDVREPHEFKSGHIKDAVNVPLSRLKEINNSYPKEQELVLVCLSGNRSRMAAKRLSKAGYSHLLNLAGGMSAWRFERTK